MWCSLVNHAWCVMLGTTSNIDSLNLAKVKLVKVLNNSAIAHIGEVQPKHPHLDPLIDLVPPPIY
jgi:hypothetical protein